MKTFLKHTGRRARLAYRASRIISPVALNPGRVLVGAGIAAVVITAGVVVGCKLRQMRFNKMRNPYRMPRSWSKEDEYAVGI